MKEFAISLLKRMLEIYSPSGKEEAIASFLVEEMEKLGFNVKKDSVGNVIGEKGKGSPTILLCGHMDTVIGFIPVRETGKELWGRGAVDAKSSLAAMIVASSVFNFDENPAKILVAGVVDEEGKSRGIRNLLKEDINVDYAIFGEPSGVEKITIGYKGLLRLKITCKTDTGHSAANLLYENAVEKAFEIWNAIRKTYFSSEKTESPFYSITSSITKIKGGKGYSIMPSSCQMHIDIRIPPQTSADRVFKEVYQAIGQLSEANTKISVKVKVEDAIEPFETSSNSSLVQAISKAIREVRHKNATLLRKTGTGDMNIFGRAAKIPVVTYGPGDPKLSHTENEHIELQDYLDSVKIYQKAIKHIIRMHSGLLANNAR